MDLLAMHVCCGVNFYLRDKVMPAGAGGFLTGGYSPRLRLLQPD